MAGILKWHLTPYKSSHCLSGITKRARKHELKTTNVTQNYVLKCFDITPGKGFLKIPQGVFFLLHVVYPIQTTYFFCLVFMWRAAVRFPSLGIVIELIGRNFQIVPKQGKSKFIFIIVFAKIRLIVWCFNIEVACINNQCH